MTRSTETVTARRGFFPVVAADEVHVRQAGANGMFAAGNLTVNQGGASVMLAGGDAAIEQGGASIIAAAGDIDVRTGGAAVAAARAVRVERGTVGLVVAKTVTVHDSRVLLTPAEAAALGAALAITGFVLGKVFSR